MSLDAFDLEHAPPGRAEYRCAWRRGDPELERDAIGFWRRLAILPPSVTPQARAAELCCAAYVDGEIAAVSTATLEAIPGLRARFAMFRCATAPEHRRRWLTAQITDRSFQILEQWAAEHPQAGVKGMAAVIENPFLPSMKRRPIWRTHNVELVLVGHTADGKQVRVAWFPHARLDPPGRMRPAAEA